MVINRDVLCEGGPRSCANAKLLYCQACGATYKPANIMKPEPCPSCGRERKYERERCEQCPKVLLDRALDSKAGTLVNRAIKLHNELEAGFTVHPCDVTVEVYWAWGVLKNEIAKRDKRRARDGKGHNR